METIAAEVRDLIVKRCSLAALLKFLESHDSFALTPFNFMRILHEASGIPMVKSRELISMLDPEMKPIVPIGEIELQWSKLIEAL
jgi:hypothetical protein